MNELKKQTMSIIDKVNQNWVEALEEAEKTNQGVSLTEVMSKFSKQMVELDQSFRDFQERNGKKKKGGFF